MQKLWATVPYSSIFFQPLTAQGHCVTSLEQDAFDILSVDLRNLKQKSHFKNLQKTVYNSTFLLFVCNLF